MVEGLFGALTRCVCCFKDVACAARAARVRRGLSAGFVSMKGELCSTGWQCRWSVCQPCCEPLCAILERDPFFLPFLSFGKF